MKNYVPTKANADPAPAGRVLIHRGTIKASDLWWTEFSRLWLPVRPLHVGCPVAMMPHPIARLKEDESP